MIRIPFAWLIAAICVFAPARAVQTSGTFVTSSPTVTDWNSGWPTSGETGWNYVGQVNGASAVYLGNDWVLTAAHVGTGNFLLGGTTYDIVGGSTQGISNSDGTADLYLFQISTAPPLSSLTLSLEPVPFSETNPGDLTVMIGYGGGHGETWGADTITYTNVLVQPSGLPYVSNDFITTYGSFSAGTASGTNDAILVGGDSGGGDFIYNQSTASWTLAGINEVVGTATTDSGTITISGMVQLSTYAPQLEAITGIDQAIPEPSTWALLALGLAGLMLYRRKRSPSP